MVGPDAESGFRFDLGYASSEEPPACRHSFDGSEWVFRYSAGVFARLPSGAGDAKTISILDQRFPGVRSVGAVRNRLLL